MLIGTGTRNALGLSALFAAAFGFTARPAAAQQTLFVGNNGNSTIEKFDSNGVGTKFNTSFTSGSLRGPFGLAFDGAGNLFVANGNNNTIEKFNTTTGVGTLFANGSGLNLPIGIAFDRNGILYVANYTRLWPFSCGVAGDLL